MPRLSAAGPPRWPPSAATCDRDKFAARLINSADGKVMAPRRGLRSTNHNDFILLENLSCARKLFISPVTHARALKQPRYCDFFSPSRIPSNQPRYRTFVVYGELRSWRSAMPN